jgi:hypothetical protein
MYQRPSGQGPTPIRPSRAIAGLERGTTDIFLTVREGLSGPYQAPCRNAHVKTVKNCGSWLLSAADAALFSRNLSPISHDKEALTALVEC